MLTFDDLDHFDDRAVANLYAVLGADAEDARQRRERLLACLRFCRDVAYETLPESGVLAARRLLKRALRSQQRNQHASPEAIEDFLAGALRALGSSGWRDEEGAEVAALRHLVEREIEAAACHRLHDVTRLPALLQSLARGDFEIGPDSDLAALEDLVGKFGGRAEIGLELILDGSGGPDHAVVRLGIACGLWRWSAPQGGRITLDGGAPVTLAADDALVPVILAGVSAQGGRALSIWSQATHAKPTGRLN